MITLYIQDEPVVLKEGTSIKMVKNNPFFNGKGSRSLEVELPLKGCVQNQKVFGIIHHIAGNRKMIADRKYPFRLIGLKVNMRGTAIVTSVTNELVKIQLLEGNSSLNVLVDEEYIDEMQLGTAWEGIIDESTKIRWEQGYDVDITKMPGLGFFLRRAALIDMDRPLARKMIFGRYVETPAVALPIHSKADEKVTNAQVWVDNEAFPKSFGGQWLYPRDSAKVGRDESLSPQPYIVYVLKRILQEKGIELVEVDEWCERIIIANSKLDLRIAKLLPHWTVAEFIKQFTNFTGCILLVDGTRARCVKADDYFERHVREIREVRDEYEVAVTEDANTEQTNVWDGNVDYAWPEDDPMMRLPDTVWENAKIMEFNSYQDLWEYYGSMPDDDRRKSEVLFVDKKEERYYAILKENAVEEDRWRLTEVNYMPPLIRISTSREISTELKIVPVRFSMVNMQRVYWEQPNPGWSKRIIPDGNTYETPTMETSFGTKGGSDFSINDEINPPEDGNGQENEKQDIMEVAFYDPMNIVRHPYNHEEIMTALGVMRRSNRDMGSTPILPFEQSRDYQFPAEGPFRLTDKTEGTIGSRMRESMVDSRKTYIFTFLDDIDMDMDSLYIIGGKKYACVKMEYTITDKGVDKLKTGHFYEYS